jgi:3-hydroxymyristoyl/3-hydroxydecanoyl-(acyl carrier protein) dehydratase
VPADVGTLRMTARLTKVSQSAGMVIQHYDIAIHAGSQPVYEGDTYFGYFTKAALAQQVGIRDAQETRFLQETGFLERAARTQPYAFPTTAALPVAPWRMIDRIDLLIPDGGPHGLGVIQGSKDVNPAEWFFKAHFHQDPVWPGSLGLEAFLQLLKVLALERWGASDSAIIHTPTPGVEHRWVYRGQVIPKDRRVTVTAWITAADDGCRELRAAGILEVDGRVIYQMSDFGLRMAN